MSLYSNLAAVSLAQIAAFGRDVSLKQPQGDPTWNPATGTLTPATSTTVTVKAVITDFQLKEVDGTLIQSGDKIATVAASSVAFDIDNKATITDGNDLYAVVSVMVIKPAMVPLIYKLQCRKVGT